MLFVLVLPLNFRQSMQWQRIWHGINTSLSYSMRFIGEDEGCGLTVRTGSPSKEMRFAPQRQLDANMIVGEVELGSVTQRLYDSV